MKFGLKAVDFLDRSPENSRLRESGRFLSVLFLVPGGRIWGSDLLNKTINGSDDDLGGKRDG